MSSPLSDPPSSPSTRQTRSILAMPSPLKRVFDRVPLITYPEDGLPSRSVSVPRKAERADIHAFYDAHVREKSAAGKGEREEALHAFFSWADSSEDRSPKVASFNPGCLKWQV